MCGAACEIAVEPPILRKCAMRLTSCAGSISVKDFGLKVLRSSLVIRQFLLTSSTHNSQ